MKKLVILTTALFVFAGTANASTTLLSEDFKGKPGVDLTTKGWTNGSGKKVLLSATTIDVGNSGDFTGDGYSSYTKALSSPVKSLALREQLIVQGAFYFASLPAKKKWVRVASLFDAGKTIGPGMAFEWSGSDVLVSGTGGSGFPSLSGSQINIGPLSTNTLYDSRIVIIEGGAGPTDDTISWEYKARFSHTWKVVDSKKGSFVAIDTFVIDGEYSGLVDTIRVTVGPPPVQAGDVNLDGFVGMLDATIILGNCGNTGAARADGDLSGDGTVNDTDLQIVKTNWGSGRFQPLRLPPRPKQTLALRVEEVSGAPAGKKAYDFYANIETNMGVMELLLYTYRPGQIYQNAAAPDKPNETFASYVTAKKDAVGPNPAQTLIYGGAMNLGGGADVTFNTSKIDIAWSPGGGIMTGRGDYHVARVVVDEHATVNYQLTGPRTGEPKLEKISAILREPGMTKMPPPPRLKTAVLGGVDCPTAEELAAMQKGNYLLHARGGKLTKVPAQKCRLPHDPKGHAQVIYTAQDPRDRNTVYVNQRSIICKTTDRGKTWTSYPREFGEDGTGHFKILSDGTFISVWGQKKGPAEVMVSHDEGRTWKKISEFTAEVPGLEFRSRALPLYRLPDDTLLWTGKFADPDDDVWYVDVAMFRSEDGGMTWSRALEFCEHSPEGGMTRLPSGRVLAVVRYQRPTWPSDPENLIELTRGGATNVRITFPYKHLFLLDSDDGGRSWTNFRQLTTAFGQCYGFPTALSDGTVVVVRHNGYNPNRSGLAMISYDEGQTWEDEAYYLYAPELGHQGNAGYAQSVLLDDDLILTIAGTTSTRGGHAAAIGRSILTAIRWKPEKKTKGAPSNPRQSGLPGAQVNQKIGHSNPAIERAMRGLEAAIPQAEKDPTRPVFHFRSPARLCHACRPLYHQGYYHLFYQLGPHTDRMSVDAELFWGHARSRDLVHWEHLPIALWPSKELGERRCNSGCVVINGQGQPMIFYTHCPPITTRAAYRQQWVALGDEDLINWEKHPDNPLITVESWASPNLIKKIIKWGDPFIFRVQDRAFMLVGVMLQKEVILPIWEAEDDELLRWKYRGILFRRPKPELKDMECPNLFPLADKWVLICSPGGLVRYYIGTFDPDSVSFQVEQEGIVDHSYGKRWPAFLTRGLYATNIIWDDKGRTIMGAWASGFKLDRGWNGCLALPRVLSIGADGHLRQEPIPELQKLRAKHIRLESLNLSNGGHVLEEPLGDTLEILAVFEPGDAEAIGLKMRRSDDGLKAVTISHDGRTLDVAGTAFPFKLGADEKTLTLRIFLDKSLMEVFVNGGRECVTKVIYPPEQDLGLELFAIGGSATVQTLDVWRMKDAWRMNGSGE